jgi:hypothetical protein
MRALLLAAACCLACASYPRGTFGAAAVEPLPLALEVVAEQVEGRACGVPESGYDSALEHALSLAPGADALTDASWSFERFCIVVRGRAVRIARPPAPGS